MSVEQSQKFYPFDQPTFVQFTMGLFIFVGYLSALRFFSITSKVSQPVQQQATSSSYETSEIRPTLAQGYNNLIVGQTSELSFQLDTGNQPIIGAQLVYTIESDSIPTMTADQIVIPQESGLVPIHTSVEQTSNGQIVKIALRPAGSFNPELSYTNSTFVDIAKMQVQPSKAGNIVIHFDPTLTTVLNSDTKDTLKPLKDFSIEVKSSPSTN